MQKFQEGADTDIVAAAAEAVATAQCKLLQPSVGDEWGELKRKGQGIVEWGFQSSVRAGDLVGSFTSWTSTLGGLAGAGPLLQRTKGTKGTLSGKKVKKRKRGGVRGAAMTGEDGLIDLRSAQLMAAIMAREHQFRLLIRLTAAVAASDEELAMQLALGPETLRGLLDASGGPQSSFVSRPACPTEPAEATTEASTKETTEETTGPETWFTEFAESRAVRAVVPFDSSFGGANAGGWLSHEGVRSDYASFLVTELHRLLDEGVSLNKPFLNKKRTSCSRPGGGGKKKRRAAVAARASSPGGVGNMWGGLSELGKGFSKSLSLGPSETGQGVVPKDSGLVGKLRSFIWAEITPQKREAASIGSKKRKKSGKQRKKPGTVDKVKTVSATKVGIEAKAAKGAKVATRLVEASGARVSKAKRKGSKAAEMRGAKADKHTKTQAGGAAATSMRVAALRKTCCKDVSIEGVSAEEV